MAGKESRRAAKRLGSVDVFRGAAVAAFLFFNFLTSLVRPGEMPSILLHNQVGTMLPGDFIAGFFAFLIGIGLSLSYEKRKGDESLASIFRRNIARGAALLALGLFLDGIDGLTLQWGVLQTLGISLLIATAFLPFSNRIRALSAAIILIIYGCLLLTDAGFAGLLQIRHGGPIGAVSYASIAISGMIAGNWLVEADRKESVKKLLLASLALLLAGAIASTAIAPSKLLATPSYSIYVSCAAFAVMGMLFHAVEIGGLNPGILQRLGRNSLLAWVLQYPLFYWPLALAGAYFSTSLAAGLAAAGALTVISYVIVFFIGKSGYRLSI